MSPSAASPECLCHVTSPTFLWTSAFRDWSWLSMNSVFTLAQEHLLSSDLLPKVPLSKFKAEVIFLVLYSPFGSQDCSRKLSYLRRSL